MLCAGKNVESSDDKKGTAGSDKKAKDKGSSNQKKATSQGNKRLEDKVVEKSLKMTSMRSLIIFTVTLILFKIVGGWQYERPQDWPGICQRGQSQSPVNLEDEIYQVFFLYYSAH